MAQALTKKEMLESNFFKDLYSELHVLYDFDPQAKARFKQLVLELVERMQNKDFLNSIGFLGEAANELARKKEFINRKLLGLSDVYESNVVLYLVKELLELVSNAVRDSRENVITVRTLNKIIEDDYELSAAFLGIPLPD